MQILNRILIALFMIAIIGGLQGCWWNKVTILDTDLTYSELCSKQLAKNKCAADGGYSVIFNKNRVPLPSNPPDLASEQAGKDLLVKEALGKVWNIDNHQLSTCQDCLFNSSDYFDSFPGRKIDVSLLTKEQVKATVEAAVNAAIQGKVDDEPKVSAELTASLTSAIQSNAFTLANYSVHDIYNNKLEEIRRTNKCGALLSNPNNYLITSVAIISSSGRFSESQQKDIEAQIQAELQNAKFQGSAIDGNVATKLALSVVIETERKVSTITQNVNSVYSYGLWNPSLDSKKRTHEEIITDIKKIQQSLKNVELIERQNMFLK